MVRFNNHKKSIERSALMDIIQTITEIITTGFKNNLTKLVEDRQDISQFILSTQKDLNEAGRCLVAEALEILDEAVKGAEGRSRKWYVQEKDKPNSIATVFGEVHYTSTYYRSKEDGSYARLSDELVGIEAHDKMDLSLKAKCVELAEKTPYRRSGKMVSEALELSGQTVMNAIRWLGPVAPYKGPENAEKRKVEYLFIEADEDHVTMRDHRCGEPKLVYVHEGIRQVSEKRWELKNPIYFSGMYRESEELWEIVEEYIENAYDREQIKTIYLSGDRGSWVRTGARWIRDAVYVVDKYHLLKYVRQAGGHIENGCDAIWEAINKQDREYLEVVFETIRDHPDSNGKGKTLAEAFRYIRESYDTTKHYLDEAYRGCSAEGHVSHILSDRLSSRPRVWCERGIDEMARLRVTVKNGGEIYPLMLEKKQERKRKLAWRKVDAKIVHKRKLAAGAEMQHNIPYINRGQVCESLRMMKSFRNL